MNRANKVVTVSCTILESSQLANINSKDFELKCQSSGNIDHAKLHNPQRVNPDYSHTINETVTIKINRS